MFHMNCPQCGEVGHCEHDETRKDREDFTRRAVSERQPGAIDVAAYNERTWRDIQARTIAQKWSKHRTSSNDVWEARLDNAIQDALEIGLAAGRARGIEEERKRCEGIARDAVVEWSSRGQGRTARILHDIAEAIAKEGA